jgi:hypothetical protein
LRQGPPYAAESSAEARIPEVGFPNSGSFDIGEGGMVMIDVIAVGGHGSTGLMPAAEPVRPNGHVAWSGEEPAELLDAMARRFGAPAA